MSSAEATKLDILLDLRKNGYNLVDGDQPEIMTMPLGGGYTLECNVKTPSEEWKIFFDDGIETTEYPATSKKVVYTHRKDSDKLIKEYEAGLKAINAGGNSPSSAKREETTPSKKKKNSTMKNRKRGDVQERPGMMLPIVYPSELKGSFMRFKQWTAGNGVIPAESEVVILDDDDYNYKVTIPKAHLSFDIPKNKAEVVEV